MIPCWLDDIQEGDILLFQSNLKTLLAVFGISQEEATDLLEVAKGTIQSFMKFKKVMTVSQYAFLRTYLQNRPKTTLQRDALFYFTHRAQNATIVIEMTEQIDNLVKTFPRYGPQTAREYSFQLSQSWLQMRNKNKKEVG